MYYNRNEHNERSKDPNNIKSNLWITPDPFCIKGSWFVFEFDWFDMMASWLTSWFISNFRSIKSMREKLC